MPRSLNANVKDGAAVKHSLQRPFVRIAVARLRDTKSELAGDNDRDRKITRLELLKELYGSIVIPPAVSAELNGNSISFANDWIQVIEPVNRVAVDALRADLDAGESEAIVLAQQLNASLLLIDERLGRRKATMLGLSVTGLLGIVAEAKKRGFIPACAPLLDDMIGRAGFRIGERLRADYLKALGEIEQASSGQTQADHGRIRLTHARVRVDHRKGQSGNFVTEGAVWPVSRLSLQTGIRISGGYVSAESFS